MAKRLAWHSRCKHEPCKRLGGGPEDPQPFQAPHMTLFDKPEAGGLTSAADFVPHASSHEQKAKHGPPHDHHVASV